MKTTIDIPDQTLGTLRRLTRAATNEAAVLTAIEEYRRHQEALAPVLPEVSEEERHRRTEAVRKMFGSCPDFPTNEEIEASDIARQKEIFGDAG